jgi:hypothetical protein
LAWLLAAPAYQKSLDAAAREAALEFDRISEDLAELHRQKYGTSDTKPNE